MVIEETFIHETFAFDGQKLVRNVDWRQMTISLLTGSRSKYLSRYLAASYFVMNLDQLAPDNAVMQ